MSRRGSGGRMVRRVLAAVLILNVLAAGAYLCVQSETLLSKQVSAAESLGTETVTLEAGGAPLTVRFIPRQRRLLDVALGVKVMQDVPPGSEVLIAFSRAGERVPLLEQRLPAATWVNGQYAFVSLQQQVTPGQYYLLTVQLKSSGGSLIFTTDCEKLPEAAVVLESGAPLKLLAVYEAVNVGLLAAALLCVLTGLMVLLPPLLSEEYRSWQPWRIARWVWLVLAPVALFLVVEALHKGELSWGSLAWPTLTLYLLMQWTLWLLCGRSGAGQIIVGGAWFSLALISAMKFQFRGTPLLPWDVHALRTALGVAEQYRLRLVPAQWLAVAGMVLMVWVSAVATLRTPRWSGRRGVATLLVAASLTGTVALFIWPNSPLTINMNLNNWSLETLYREQGFTPALLINCRQLFIRKPEGYNPRQVAASISDAPEPVPPQRMSEPPVNIIVIMNEALADLQSIVPFETNRPVLPALRALMAQGLSGRLQVSVLGGGTDMTEFEMLTGHSGMFLPPESSAYQQYLQAERGNTASLASQLRGLGYETLAIHPAAPGNWNRAQVYPMLGFDRFLALPDLRTDWGDIGAPTLLRGLYSDAALYQEVAQQILQKPTNGKLFLFCVTMQNHGGYEAAIPELEAITYAPEAQPNIAHYLTLAAESDRALSQLTDFCKTLEEPTLLVVFGDHQPAESKVLFGALTGQSWEVPTLVQSQHLHETPLLLWHNRGLQPDDVGDISVNYVSELLLEVAGLPLTPYQRFLAQLKQSWPVTTQQLVMNAQGQAQGAEAALFGSPALRDYQAAQYNLLFDGTEKQTQLFELTSEAAQ